MKFNNFEKFNVNKRDKFQNKLYKINYSKDLNTFLILSQHFLKKYFFISEHILCKESIMILKKFNFEILTHLYILRSHEFIYAILVTCIYMCVYVSEYNRV